MSKATCESCSKPKAQYNCGICDCSICKSCAEFTDESTFFYATQLPDFLQKNVFCLQCYTEKVDGEIQKYNETVEQAKNIMIFTIDQAKETRLVKRLELPYQFTDMPDPEEIEMKMAYLAVLAGYNAVIDVELVSKKVRTGSYQTAMWSGTGIPAHVIVEKLPKDRSFSSRPN